MRLLLIALVCFGCTAEPQFIPESATHARHALAGVWVRDSKLYFHNPDGKDRLLGCLRDDDGALTLEDCK